MLKTLAVAGSVAALGVAGLALAPSASANENPGYPHCRHVPVNYISGTLGDDRLIGTDCQDVISGRFGNDRINGLESEDVLRGGRGNDRINSVDHAVDLVSGGAGTDRCVGNFYDTFYRCEVIVIRSPFPA